MKTWGSGQRWVLGLVLVGATILVQSPAHAEGRRWVTVTVSPLHLVLPVVEVTAEVRLLPIDRPLSVAAILGFGKMTFDDSVGDDVKVNVYELGGQLVYYPIGDFKSLQLGAEALWLKVDAQSLDNESLSGSAAGVAVGPFVGYKLMTGVGFTFVAQLGVAGLVARAEAEDTDTGDEASVEGKSYVPILNLNLGWAF